MQETLTTNPNKGKYRISHETHTITHSSRRQWLYTRSTPYTITVVYVLDATTMLTPVQQNLYLGSTTAKMHQGLFYSMIEQWWSQWNKTLHTNVSPHWLKLCSAIDRKRALYRGIQYITKIMHTFRALLYLGLVTVEITRILQGHFNARGLRFT